MTQTTLINDIYGVVGSQGEITDLNVDGKNLGLVRATTSPGGGIGITQIVSLTQAQYDAIVTKDPATLYVIVEG